MSPIVQRRYMDRSVISEITGQIVPKFAKGPLVFDFVPHTVVWEGLLRQKTGNGILPPSSRDARLTTT
jgi:hypothetical protein